MFMSRISTGNVGHLEIRRGFMIDALAKINMSSPKYRNEKTQHSNSKQTPI